MIVAALRQGRVTASGARTWASQYRDGQDVRYWRSMAVTVPVQERPGPRQLGLLTSELAAIVAAAPGASAGDDPADEYEALWGPGVDDRRQREVAAAVRRANDIPEADLKRVLFDVPGET